MTNKEIMEKIMSLTGALDHTEKLYRIAQKDIYRQISEIRAQCPHDSTEYVPDASGNNDSYHYCLVCGQERKRFK